MTLLPSVSMFCFHSVSFGQFLLIFSSTDFGSLFLITTNPFPLESKKEKSNYHFELPNFDMISITITCLFIILLKKEKCCVPFNWL